MMKNSTLALVAEADVKPVAQAVDEPIAAGQHPNPEPATSNAGSSPERGAPLLQWFDEVDWSGLMRSWLVRLLSLAGGVLLWHLACAYNLNFFIRFEHVPAPLVVMTAFINHVQELEILRPHHRQHPANHDRVRHGDDHRRHYRHLDGSLEDRT